MRARALLSRVAWILTAAATLAVVFPGAVPSASSARPGPALLPDLDQEFPSELEVILDGTRLAPRYRLGFRSAVRNVGLGPLVISGHRRPDLPTMTADQLIEHADGAREVVPTIGTMRFVSSATHRHWHYLHFDRYELRRAGSATVLERDGKSGFCLGDRYPVTTATVRGALPEPVYVGRCGLGETGLLSVEEGISVGWGDSYSPFLEFQSLPLDGLPAGRYVLVHRVNADRSIREVSYANDAASILLELRWNDGVPHLHVLASCPDSDACDGVAKRSDRAHR
jgi:hypothetical protein